MGKCVPNPLSFGGVDPLPKSPAVLVGKIFPTGFQEAGDTNQGEGWAVALPAQVIPLQSFQMQNSAIAIIIIIRSKRG